MKKALFFILILIGNSIYAELNVVVDVNKFLDTELNTIYEINYEIPYKNLEFKKNKYGYGAEINVAYTYFMGEKSKKGDFTTRFILSDYLKTISNDTFKDRFTMTLKHTGLKMDLVFKDVTGGSLKNWSYDFVNLKKNALLSDLEFSSSVVWDTTAYLQKFHRADSLYIINGNHIFSIPDESNIFLYYELYDYVPEWEKSYVEEISVQKDDISIQTFVDTVKINKQITPIHRKIDISGLEKGLYNLQINVTNGAMNERRTDIFSVKDAVKKARIRFFNNNEDEIAFTKYFLNSGQRKKIGKLELEAQLNFIDRFWNSKDIFPGNDENEYVDLIRKRLVEVNRKFSYGKKDGWRTDRGRIYLKYGEPDDIIKETTNSYQTDVTNENPRLVYTALGAKEFHIWKYRSSYNETYIFFDTLGNRSFNLIYAGNDDSEVSKPNWKYYLGGSNFDMQLLE